MDVQAISCIVITTNGRLRKLSRPKVKELADSITEIGLLNPITVMAAGSEYTLVAGRHRLEAARLLGWQTIPAVVVDLVDLDRRLAEVDENLIRANLSDLERATHLSTRKHLYELKHPETKRGGDRGNQHTGGRQNADSAFSQDAAKKTGRSRRVIEEDVQIAESIPEDVREAIHDTPLADSKTDLMTFARLPEAVQREIVSTVDLNDKQAVRAAVSERRPAAPARDPEPGDGTTQVLMTVEGFARAALTLFAPAECRRLCTIIREAIASTTPRINPGACR